MYQLVETSELCSVSSLEAVRYFQARRFRYDPALLRDTSHKYIIGAWVFQVQGSTLVEAFNARTRTYIHIHTHSTSSAGRALLISILTVV